MYTVTFSLLPVFVGSIYLFGIRVFWIVIISSLSAIATEALAQLIMKRRLTIWDGSALLTGVLLAFNLPVNAPLWLPLVGSLFAILVAKQAFGGLGYNFMNPALAGRAFLMASWPEIMTHRWSSPIIGSMSGIGAFTEATPLNTLKNYGDNFIIMSQINSKDTIFNLLFGRHGGCLGETSAILILIGGVFLILIKYIDWRIPLSYIGTVGVVTEILWLLGVTKANGFFHILAGGLFLGAFFMATDYVTSPITHKGRWIFGIGCGVITVLIRLWGGYPEGVCYSILLMNCFVPLINSKIRPRKLGERRKK
jgi:electron transport complex protein RnfD